MIDFSIKATGPSDMVFVLEITSIFPKMSLHCHPAGQLGHFVLPRCASPEQTGEDSHLYTPSNDSGITDVKGTVNTMSLSNSRKPLLCGY